MLLTDYLDYLVTFLQQSVKDAKAKGVILGISGGIDSAVVAMLAKKAFPDNYLTVWMPIESSQDDWDAVNELIAQGDLKSLNVNLAPAHETLMNTLKMVDHDANLSELVVANAKARLRMTTLYALGQANNYLVLGTDNLDEWYTGYFTKFGDGAADIAPLIKLYKHEVREAAKILGVPDVIINRPPTAGLWDGQTDEKELGFSYDEIDAFLADPKSADKKLVTRMETLHANSEHKRNLPKWPDNFQREKKKR